MSRKIIGDYRTVPWFTPVASVRAGDLTEFCCTKLLAFHDHPWFWIVDRNREPSPGSLGYAQAHGAPRALAREDRSERM